MTLNVQYDRDLKSGPPLGVPVDAAVALLR